MKRLSLLLICAFSILLTSCNKQEEIFSSENGDMKVTVTAQRYVVADPWTVKVELSMPDMKQPAVASREIVAESMTAENVKFVWHDENTCEVKIAQKDGSIASIPVRVRK